MQHKSFVSLKRVVKKNRKWVAEDGNPWYIRLAPTMLWLGSRRLRTLARDSGRRKPARADRSAVIGAIGPATWPECCRTSVYSAPYTSKVRAPLSENAALWMNQANMLGALHFDQSNVKGAARAIYRALESDQSNPTINESEREQGILPDLFSSVLAFAVTSAFVETLTQCWGFACPPTVSLNVSCWKL